VDTSLHRTSSATLFDGRDLPFKKNSFDAVLIAFVLHHAEEPVYLLEEARRVCSGPVLVVEDTPCLWAERVWGRLHTRSFSKRMGIGWNGKVRLDPEWRRLFKRAGLVVRRSERLGRWERLPPVSRTAFVLETTS
jgi:SAM-dependent methyltransferase